MVAGYTKLLVMTVIRKHAASTDDKAFVSISQCSYGIVPRTFVG